MSQYVKFAIVFGVLMTVGHSSNAMVKEKYMPLGVVNGQVRDNQRLEVKRTLPFPELYREEDPNVLPVSLLIRQATAQKGESGTLLLTLSQVLPDGGITLITVNVELLIDGKKVRADFQEQGADVLIPVPPAYHQVVLRSDTPVTLAVPANWRGDIRVVMEINGNR